MQTFTPKYCSQSASYIIFHILNSVLAIVEVRIGFEGRNLHPLNLPTVLNHLCDLLQILAKQKLSFF